MKNHYNSIISSNNSKLIFSFEIVKKKLPKKMINSKFFTDEKK